MKTEERRKALIRLQEATLTAEEETEEPLFVDSGATAHITNKRSWFDRYSEYSILVKFKMGDGSHLTAYGQGDILTWAFNGIRWETKHLKDVKYIPLIKYNLFSLGAANEKRLQFKPDAKFCLHVLQK